MRKSFVNISTKVPIETRDFIKNEASKEDRSISYIARKILEDYVRIRVRK